MECQGRETRRVVISAEIAAQLADEGIDDFDKYCHFVFLSLLPRHAAGAHHHAISICYATYQRNVLPPRF